MGKGQELYEDAKKIIPGGTQLLSKRPEMFLPDKWPAYYDKAKGCEVWDLDGNRYYDMCFMGIGKCILGYADDDVDEAVKACIDKASATTLNCYEEKELADKMLSMNPWADMIRFARTGGEMVAIAVRIARAYTGKEIVLFCGYHGWHDWYLAANLKSDDALVGHLLPGLDPAGVPQSLKDTSFPFHYNDLAAFKELLKEHTGKIAAVVMEPTRHDQPKDGFLDIIREETEKQDIPLIFDEITSGLRFRVGGVHEEFGITPDIAVYGKALGNGFPITAVVGKKKVMESAQRSFISSSLWTERTGFVAALATLKKLEEKDVPKHLEKMGCMVRDGWSEMAKKHDIKIKLMGRSALSLFSFDYDEPLVLKTLFTQYMLEEGFLASTAFYASYAHKEEHVKKYIDALDTVFGKIADAIKSEDPESYLDGPVCHGGFKRLS